MRRSALVLLAFVVAIVPFGTASGAKRKGHQHVQGTIAVPQPFPADNTCIYRAQRSIMSASDMSGPNGVVGYTFRVDKRTAGSRFVLKTSRGSGLDISFYSELGDPADPTTAPSNIPFETPGPGGEKGKVPKGFPIAFVCMTEGANASFTYMAGKGVK
jgi:hypothetical protein